MIPSRLGAIFTRLRTFARERGAGNVAKTCLWWASQWVLGRIGRGEIAHARFEWEGHSVPYLHHGYNYTWLNERAVEVPLAMTVLREHANGTVLEIGNVLGHYATTGHLVVDKYEQATGVVNLDVVDLDLVERFDLILAVSTLEHVGLDEDVKDPDKVNRAVEHLKSLLAPGGWLWITVPVGYNSHLDQGIRDGTISFDRLTALRREDLRNLWRQVPVEHVWDAAYDRLLYTAHGVVIAEFRAPETP